MLLSIIIISYNTKELLEQCLESIRNSFQNKDKISNSKSQISSKSQIPNQQLSPDNVEVIVVDNNSSDGSQEYLKQLTVKNSRLKVKTIFNDDNVGFARAVNQGIRKAEGKYILLLNSDIRVLSGSIEKLIEIIEKKKDAGLAAPKLFCKDGRTSQASCYNQPTIKRAFQEYWLKKEGVFEKYLPRGGHPTAVEAVVGAAMLIPKTTIDLVGYLSEKFFMYYEDLEFCRRLKKAGLKVYYVPRAKMIHHHGASGRKEPRKVNRYLIESSKKFHGVIKHFLITVIIKLSLVTQKSYFIVLLLSAIITAILLTFLIIYFR
jgi:GT2 family glycosyltransferase